MDKTKIIYNRVLSPDEIKRLYNDGKKVENWTLYGIMQHMKNIIHFSIFKDGEYYTASAVDFAIVTQAKTLDKLTQNIQEAVEVYFHGEDMRKIGFSPTPSILANIEIKRNSVDKVHS